MNNKIHFTLGTSLVWGEGCPTASILNTLRPMATGQYSAMLDWCKDMLGEAGDIHDSSNDDKIEWWVYDGNFIFKREEHRTAFMLRWS